MKKFLLTMFLGLALQALHAQVRIGVGIGIGAPIGYPYARVAVLPPPVVYGPAPFILPRYRRHYCYVPAIYNEPRYHGWHYGRRW